MNGHIETWRDFAFWWAASLFAGTMIVAAKLALLLYGMASDPPSDPVMETHWARRRRWMAISEISALPAFATISVVLAAYQQMNPIAGVLIAMAEGVIGFPLMIDGAAWLFRRRLGMQAASPAPPKGDQP